MARQLYQGAVIFHSHEKVSRDATFIALSWRDRSCQVISERAMARQLYQGAVIFHSHEKVSREPLPEGTLARYCPDNL
nr:hypothetical protein [Nitrospirota bacterium]